MRLLFAKGALAFPRSSGHDVHTYYMMKACRALGHTIALATAEPPSDAATAGLDLDAGFALRGGCRSMPGDLPGTRLQKKFRSFWGVRDEQVGALARAASDWRADAVVVGGLDALPYFPALSGVIRVWYAADEWVLHHCSQLKFRDLALRLNLQGAAIKGLYERAHRRLVDRAWVVTESDRKAMRWIAGVRNVDVLPNGVDSEHYCPTGAPVEPDTATFWGRLDFGPNVQALEWFCDRVWPLVLRDVPNARFSIMGFSPGTEMRRLAEQTGVELRPNVSDLRRAACQHAAVVLPFVSGAGIKNKLLEAAAMGLPIICTPIATRGLKGRVPAILASTPEDFASAIVRTWRDPARARLGAAARAWVSEHHTWESTAQRAMESLEGTSMSAERLEHSRRSFLITLGGAAAASLVTTPFADGHASRPGSRQASPSTLTQSDIEYLGLFRVPNDPGGTRFGFSAGAMTARTVNGNLQFLICGASPSRDPVYEISYPGYGTSLATSPVASLITVWGDIYQGRKLTARASGANVRGLLWYPGPDQLFWSYGDPYNAGSTSWDPSIGMSLLSGSGSVGAYGPWRTSVPSQQTRGYMMPIPSWFSSQYSSGMPLSIGAPITSGNQASPWGAAAIAWAPPMPSTAPDLVQAGSTYRGERASVATKRLLFYDMQHPQARDTNFRRCAWNKQYDCSAGSSISPGAPTFQSVDTVSAAAWVDLPDKQGVVFFGQIATKLDGFDYGSDDMPHIWYGVQYCCHGQNGAPMWMATGPATPTSVPYIWIYDPADLGSVASGRTASYKITPKAGFPVSALTSAFPGNVGWYYWGGAHFDPASRLLFVSTGGDNVTNPKEPRPIIRVFHIKSSESTG